ncbi:MAG: CDP-6-deoxy-delta-3,4-glucoseen reductase [Xanthomonadales bacterium]|nr:CDP-6-deoxy-delta-3,4-glucoseen reductase [Xanthomonadales bacterium]
MATFTVKIAGSERSFSVRDDETLLEGALRQGVMLPYSCKNGTCGSCKGTVLSGSVNYPHHPAQALEPGDAEVGLALLCQAVPCSDLVLEVREIEAVRDIPVLKLPARVAEKSLLADNVVKLVLKLPRAQRLQFLAGQYIDILLPEGKRRAFSIASSPAREGEIELHVRHVEGGGFTGWVFHEMEPRAILRLEGPLGTFFVRHDEPKRPMIMMGGGTGFAPLKSMIEDLLAHGDTRPLHLFWGARTQEELYQEDLIEQWVAEHDHITYTSAVSDQCDERPQKGFAGFVHEAVLHAYDDLTTHDVYMSGPPAMIDAARHAFVEHGCREDRLFYDSFEFGSDVPVSILAKPH